jgi:ElaB/YqjD/DUF883 family membrane-anchored ribosome-binding protein
MSEMETSRRGLIDDFNAVVEDAEKLLRALAASGAEKGTALRASAEQNLATARERLRELQGDAVERGRQAAKATDEYVHENPWRSIVAAVSVGVVIGLLIGGRR